MDNTTCNSTNSTNGTSSAFTPPPPKPFWTNLLWPLAYFTILTISLYTFSSIYRRRQAAKTAALASWFPPHRQRDVYLSLLHMDPADATDEKKKLSKVPESVLKAALMRRALEDIQRIVQIRSAKPALQALQQRGSVGDELWQRFLRAEKEIEEEVKDVVAEANAYVPNWGQTIFQSANEMNQARLLKERVAEVQSQRDSEREWWEKKKAGMEADLLKELDDESASKTTPQPAQQATQQRKTNSDDDAVLVEAGGPALGQGGSGDGSGSVRKKNKKK